MLEISPTAADVVRAMTDRALGIEGIRLALVPSDSPNGDAPSVGVVIAPASGPSDGDQMLTQDGVAVFVDRDAVPLVEGKMLDVAQVGTDRLRLTLIDQS